MKHDNYEYDEEKDELICEGYRYRRRKSYFRKDGRKIASFFCDELRKKKDIPEFFRERLRMRDKMATVEGKKIYALRKITVEPVIGQMKENLGFRQFLLRGLEGANIELNIVGTVHNLKKIWKRLREKEKMEGREREMRSDCRGECFKILKLKVLVVKRIELLDSLRCYVFFLQEKIAE